MRVVGCDPGTSSLDLLRLVDGEVDGQVRLTPEALHANPGGLVDRLRDWGPIDLIAGPSGYGLPLVRAEAITEREIDLMSLVRDDERGTGVGVIGFRSSVRALIGSALPVVFLPGGIHLATIPRYRKVNTIDMGTADKVAVVALALRAGQAETFAVVELGTAFAAVLVVERGRLVDASAGTRGPIGLRGGGAWDGEVACRLSPISKADLFRGGLDDLGPDGPSAFRESLIKHVGALRAVTTFNHLYLSGAAADRPEIAAMATEALARFGRVVPLPSLPGAWVKHAAQGSALLADGLAGGRHADLVDSLDLRHASGTAWDHLHIRPDRGAARGESINH